MRRITAKAVKRQFYIHYKSSCRAKTGGTTTGGRNHQQMATATSTIYDSKPCCSTFFYSYHSSAHTKASFYSCPPTLFK